MKRCLLLLALLLSMPAGAQPKTPVEVPLKIKTFWHKLDESSALRFQQALLEGKPARAVPAFGSVRREFRVPQRRLVLGEPLLVEYRVSNSGATQWDEPVGGRYRGSGRDDNFIFLLRGEDGQWVADPYGEVFNFGGISTTAKVDKTSTFSYWHPVQRWCALNKPGRYQLYALRWTAGYKLWGRSEAINAQLPKRFRFDQRQGLLEAATGETSQTHQLKLDWQAGHAPPSPLKLQPDLVKELKRRHLDPTELSTVGQFSIEVVAGEPDLERWLSVASQERKNWPDNKATAARMALWYSQVGSPSHLARWLKDATSLELTGLALNPSPQAPDMLKQARPEETLGALHRMQPQHRAKLRPWLRQLRDSPKEQVRTQATQVLDGWKKS